MLLRFALPPVDQVLGSMCLSFSVWESDIYIASISVPGSHGDLEFLTLSSLVSVAFSTPRSN